MNFSDDFEKYWNDFLEDCDEDAVAKITKADKEFVRGIAFAFDEVKTMLINEEDYVKDECRYNSLHKFIGEVSKELCDNVKNDMDRKLDDIMISLVEGYVE